MFKKLGRAQKRVLKKIVEDDYYILQTYDVHRATTDIVLADDFGNIDCNVAQITLDSLMKRGILEMEDVSMCLDLEQTKFFVKEEYATTALNAIYR